jgi:hypothetical protein
VGTGVAAPAQVPPACARSREELGFELHFRKDVAARTLPAGRRHGCCRPALRGRALRGRALRGRHARRARPALRSLPGRLGRQVDDQAGAIEVAGKILFALTTPSGSYKDSGGAS